MATYAESWGVRINVTTGMDLTGNTTLELLVKKPNGTTVAWDLTVVSLLEGTCYYNTVDGDLDLKGQYLVQAHLITASNEYYGNMDKFFMYEQLEVTA